MTTMGKVDISVAFSQNNLRRMKLRHLYVLGHSELLVTLRTGHLESLIPHGIKVINDMGK